MARAAISNARPVELLANSPAAHDPSIQPAPRLADLPPVALAAPAVVPGSLASGPHLAHAQVADSALARDLVAPEALLRLAKRLVRSARLPEAAVVVRSIQRPKKAR